MQSKLMTRDRDGDAVLNFAGDPIKQMKDDNTIGFQITANVAAIPNYLGRCGILAMTHRSQSRAFRSQLKRRGSSFLTAGCRR